MIPHFDFKKPVSIPELKECLNSFNNDSSIIAGGTDVVPGFQQESSRFVNIKQLVDINNIPELKEIKIVDNNLLIGAGVTFSDVCKNSLAKNKVPLLVKAAQTVGSLQIRNRATVAGNFVNNAPCADSVPPLLVYNASINILSPNGFRLIPLQDFLIRPYKTQLLANECVTEIIIPLTDKNLKGDFYKLGRRSAVSISRITLAVLMDVQNSIIKEFRVASGAITPIGKRFFEIEEKAVGKAANSGTFMEIAENMGESVLETTGLRWSTAYKLPVLQQMLYQLIENINAKESE
ncbi:MAG: FAD binding domain-containing protein [Bacteroidota bacterium]|nr:FAD binding domain-containing protein [Bacteroidota bacterium]